MHKRIVSIMALVLLLNLPVGVLATPTTGKACSKSGTTQISKGYKFKCLKIGNKLLWSKTTKIRTTEKSNISGNSNSKSSASPSVKSLEAKLEQPCDKNGLKSNSGNLFLFCTKLSGKLTWQVDTFQNLLNIWNDVKQISQSKPVPKTALSIRTSPLVNTQIKNTILNSLISASRFWQDQFLPESPIPVLFFTEKEKLFFQNQMKLLNLPDKCIQQQLDQFDDEVKRNGKNANAAGYAGCENIFFFDFYIGTGRSSVNLNDLKVGAHEYTHSGQFGAITEKSAEFAPCWFIEGGAEFYGTVLGARDKNDLLESIQDEVWGGFYLDNSNMASKPSDSFASFIEENGTDYNHQICGPNGAYAVGAVATQYLYTLKGQVGILDGGNSR